MRFVAYPLLLTLCLVAATPAARADAKDEAREAYRRGSQHYKLGEFAEALVEFKDAYRKFEDSVFLFNIAQCERQLGMRADAIRQYRLYLSDAPNAPNRDEVLRLVAALEHELSEERARARTEPQAAPASSAPAPGSAANAPAAVDLHAPVEAAPHADATLTSHAVARRDAPVYKKWWLWTVVGVVVAGGAAAGVAVASTHDKSAPSVTTGLGTAHPF